MTDETTPKTAIEFLFENKFPPVSAEERMKAYARQVAQQVRQQCAQEARVKNNVEKEYIDPKEFGKHSFIQTVVTPAVDKESILSVDIEQFIK